MDLITEEGHTIEDVEYEIHESDVEKQSNQINHHDIQKCTPQPVDDEALNEQLRQEGLVQRSEDPDLWDKPVKLIEAEQKQSQLGKCIEHLNIEKSNEMEIKLKEQNETKPKLVQAKKKKTKSKAPWKLVFNKYPKGKRPP